MQISTTRLNSIAESSRAAAARRIAAWLERNGDPAFPRMSPADRVAFAQRAVDTAAWFGLTSDRATAWFADTQMGVGPRFYLQPSIYRCLTRPGISDQAKVRRAIALTSNSDWEEAARL